MNAPRTEAPPRHNSSDTPPHFRTESHPFLGDGYVELLLVKTAIA